MQESARFLKTSQPHFPGDVLTERPGILNDEAG
jgi:hypothetical protein